MTEEQVKKIGFTLEKGYEHDDWYTYRYSKGLIKIEFTYEVCSREVHTIDITLDEIIAKKVSFDDLKELDRILNKVL